MNFQEEYEKRLRRVCGVSDDTLRVDAESEMRYEGHCDDCGYMSNVALVVTVYTGKVTEKTVGKLVAQKEFYNLETFMDALYKVEV